MNTRFLRRVHTPPTDLEEADRTMKINDTRRSRRNSLRPSDIAFFPPIGNRFLKKGESREGMARKGRRERLRRNDKTL